MLGGVAILGCLSNSNLHIFVSSEFLNKFAISVILVSCLGTSLVFVLIFPPWTDIASCGVLRSVCLEGWWIGHSGIMLGFCH